MRREVRLSYQERFCPWQFLSRLRQRSSLARRRKRFSSRGNQPDFCRPNRGYQTMKASISESRKAQYITNKNTCAYKTHAPTKSNQSCTWKPKLSETDCVGAVGHRYLTSFRRISSMPIDHPIPVSPRPWRNMTEQGEIHNKQRKNVESRCKYKVTRYRNIFKRHTSTPRSGLSIRKRSLDLTINIRE